MNKYMEKLSTGFFERLVNRNDEREKEPVLQVLNFKVMASGGSESTQNSRYRISMSDACMSASQINQRILNGDLAEFAIIKVLKYIINTMNNTRKVFVLVDFETLHKPGKQIGFPDVISDAVGDKTDAEARKRAPPFVHPPPAKAFPAVSALALNNIHPINSLTPYQNRWRIRARVTMKSEIKTWQNVRGEGKLFSVDLADNSGEIRGTFWKEQVDKFHHMIHANNVYFISGGSIKTANKQYTSIKNEYEISFNNTTEIYPCNDDVTDIPLYHYNFVKFNHLDKVVGTVVDVVGIVKQVGDTNSITTKKGDNLDKRDLVLVDDSNTAVTLTLWRDMATSFELTTDEHPVLAIKGANVREFQGGISVSPGGGGSANMALNPDIPESYSLKGWWMNDGYLQEATLISNQRGPGAGGYATSKLISVADTLELGKSDQTADYFNIKAQIIMTKHENCLYQACSTDGCKKKIVDLGNGSYRCEKCNKEMASFKYNAMLSAELNDFSSTHWVTFFADQVEQLTGKSPGELGQLKEQDPDNFGKPFQAILFKPHILRIRAKTEHFNDEARVKWTVQNVRPVDVNSYETFLKEQIELLENLGG